MHERIEFWIITGDGRKHWVALLMDTANGQRYAGEGSTVWEAIAWSLDEREHRRLGIVRMTKPLDAVPTITPDPALVAEAAARKAKREADRVVRLPLAEAPCTKSKSAAARRARSKKSGTKPGRATNKRGIER